MSCLYTRSDDTGYFDWDIRLMKKEKQDKKSRKSAVNVRKSDHLKIDIPYPHTHNGYLTKVIIIKFHTVNNSNHRVKSRQKQYFSHIHRNKWQNKIQKFNAHELKLIFIS